MASTGSYVPYVDQFKVSIVSFVLMMLISIALVVTSSLGIALNKSGQYKAALHHEKGKLMQSGQLTAAQAFTLAHKAVLATKTKHFNDMQIGVVFLAAIAAILSLAGLITCGRVMEDVEKNQGVTTVDAMWINTLSAIVIGLAFLAVVVGIVTAVFFANMHHQLISTTASPVEKKMKEILLSQIVLSWLAVLGGIVMYGIIRAVPGMAKEKAAGGMREDSF